MALAVIGSYLNTKARVARIEHQLDMLLKLNGIDVTKALPLSDHVKEIARDPARTIAAIKAHRVETGASLREAKDAVEAYIHSL